MKSIVLLAILAVSTGAQSLRIVNVSNIAGVDPTGMKDSAAAIRSVLPSYGSTPTTLYFPKGTYKFSTPGPIGAEECVRVTTAISLAGAPGAIFTDGGTNPPCQAQFGYFYGNTADYSFESDPGFAVMPAAFSSTVITFSTKSNALQYARGQYVYLRGTAIGQPGEYHGELNQVSVAGTAAGTVTLLWPLSSDFMADTGLQLNKVAASEIIHQVSITGITWNFHNQSILAAQVLGLQINGNTFNYLGTADQDWAQFNQVRDAVMTSNTFVGGAGVAIDPSRNPTNWYIGANVVAGRVGAGEYGANVTIAGNTITCLNVLNDGCINTGGIYGVNILGNHVTASGTAYMAFGIYDANGGPCQHVLISGNTVTVTAAFPAIGVENVGDVVSDNIVTTPGTGIDLRSGGITALRNTVNLTVGNSPYGCALIEGAKHDVVINSMTCRAPAGVMGISAVWLSDQGAQVVQAVLSGIAGTNLTAGINGNSNDKPVLLNNTWVNVTNP